MNAPAIMKIVVTGTRGIPAIQGGIETHCEELFPRLSKLGFNITLIRRSAYVDKKERRTEYSGVKLKTLYSPHLKSFEAIIHTFLAVIWARLKNTDILHIHAIGPAIMTPFARILGLKVVFTHHGPDYDRAKWGRAARFILKLGEKFGAGYANEVIVISEVIKKSLSEKYNRNDTHLIFNGVNEVVPAISADFITSLGIIPRRYIFGLGRFVEEKAFDLLIEAFDKMNKSDLQLVIAGDSDHDTIYSKRLKELAVKKGVILTGFVKGDKLNELFSHAMLFVLPSSHEGLPISLLEAMSYRLPVLVSDIPANIQVGLPPHRYFKTGDIESLVKRMEEMCSKGYSPENYDLANYDWDVIAGQTAGVYRKLGGEGDNQ